LYLLAAVLLQVWRQVRRAGRPMHLAWEEACCPLVVVEATPPPAAAAAAAARSRVRPRREQAAALVINSLAWAPDDSQVRALCKYHEHLLTLFIFQLSATAL
jgi:hypothetical protein